ncbi:DUF177 domain-containing protein [candidate division KSB1 bacterium]|nr:DUF177 domain-containing protein [candidate division KSB1 bacterium]
MKVHLAAYPAGVHRIREDLLPEELELDPSVFNAVHADLTLDRHDRYLQFEFRLHAEVGLQCDRCLADFTSAVEVRSPMIYVLGTPSRGEAIDDPDLTVIPPHTSDLDLTADLRDALILALPRKRLCRETCRGLCPTCGADWNESVCACATRSES